MFQRKITTAGGAATKGVGDVGGEVLHFLARQALPATPDNYALGHLILTNADGLAARAADAVTMSGNALSQTEADCILAAHGHRPDPDEAGRVEMRRQARQLAELAQAAAAAVADTGAVGRALAAEDDLPNRVADIVAAMVTRTEEVERRLAVSAREVEALRQEVETARGDAARDALTGLLNRRGALAAVADLADPSRVMIAICDVDRFKSVNDRYGHVVGDRVLKLVATSLEESCAGHVVARWGGEEFVVVLDGPDADQATMLIDRARDDLAVRNVKLRATDEPLGVLTFSAGIARLGKAKFDDVIRTADALLYKAKEAGRNCVVTEGRERV